MLCIAEDTLDLMPPGYGASGGGDEEESNRSARARRRAARSRIEEEEEMDEEQEDEENDNTESHSRRRGELVALCWCPWEAIRVSSLLVYSKQNSVLSSNISRTMQRTLL